MIGGTPLDLLVLSNLLSRSHLLRDRLTRWGHKVHSVPGERPDGVVLEARRRGSALRQLDRLQSQWPDIPVLVLLPHGVPADAWALVRAGASDCLLGTPSDHRLWTALRILSLLSAQENRFDAFDEDDSIELILVQPAAGRPSLADGRPVSASLAELEREAILDALGRTSGNVSEAGRLLGIPRTSLYRKLRRYGLR